MNYLLIIGLSFWDSIILVGFAISGTALFATSIILLDNGELSLPAIWAFALIGTIAGDHTSYVVGRFFGPFVEKKIGQRSARAMQKVKDLTSRYGAWGILVGRFFWLTRKITPFVCGTMAFPFSKFALADVCACTAWVSFWCIVLYFVSTYGLEFARGFILGG